MTMKDAYQWGESKLFKAGIPEARLDAWYLLEHVTGIDRAMYYAMPDKALTEGQEEQYRYFIEKRTEHIPLQHLTKEQAFMGLTFHVNEHVLIPRQDTETAVEEALKIIRTFIRYEGKVTEAGIESNSCWEKPSVRILDMCTGSGCILLSVLHYARKDAGMTAEGLGVDISPDALYVARENAKNLNIEADFLCSDLFDNVDGTYQMIISNPPYIRTAVIKTLQEEVRGHDPLMALDGKEDGLYFYRRIADGARQHLLSGGVLIFEIGFDQGEDVQLIMQRAGYRDIMVKKDLAGLDRVVIGVYDK